MVQIKIITGEDGDVQDKVNKWLEDEQEDLGDKFSILAITLSPTEGPKNGYHGQRVIITITYDRSDL